MKTRLMIQRLVKGLFGDDNPASGVLAEYNRVYDAFKFDSEWHTPQELDVSHVYVKALFDIGLLECRVTPMVKNNGVMFVKHSYRKNISGDLS